MTPQEPKIILRGFKYKHWVCRVLLGTFGTKPHPWVLYLEADGNQHEPGYGKIHDGETIARAGVYIDGQTPADDEVIIKGWSENEGMPEALQAAGIIGPELRRVPTGRVEATVHKLLKFEL